MSATARPWSAQPIPDRIAYRFSEVARALGVHHDTVRNWVERGDLHAVKIGRVRLVPAAELERLLNAGTRTTSRSDECQARPRSDF